MKIIVLGSGLVGNPMAVDLAKDVQFTVGVADKNKEALNRVPREHPVVTHLKDLSQPEEIKAAVSGYDMVINALPGCLGFCALKSVIEAKKNVVDISFFPEDPFRLNSLAVKNGIIAIIDCGVAPGLSNILVGYAANFLDTTEMVKIYVGGLPESRVWPYEYKAVFSLEDVLEEYTRPARIVENGGQVTKSALSGAEYMNFPGLGTLEAFYTDGLRTLVQTIHAPSMEEKTLRYPGHIGMMKVLRETGFFSKEKIDIRGAQIRPFDVTAKLLWPKWKLREGDRDITVMKIFVEGMKGGKKLRYVYDLLDRYDDRTQTHSMARTTGYTATVVLRMIAHGLYQKKGVTAPEEFGKDSECVSYILDGLKQRGIVPKQRIEEIIS